MNELFGVARAPRAIVFGNGQRHALGQILSRIGKHALICTDERFSSSAPMKGILDDLKAHDITVTIFDGTQAELPATSIEECVRFCEGLNPDVIVGLGGGSCMDMAKLVGLSLTHGGPLERYYGEFKVPGPIVPVVAVPTTAGTGSEVTPVAVLADNARDLKVGISSPFLIPHTAICDAELTFSCPPGLTALSGADALTHAIEAFTAVSHSRTAGLSQERVFVGKNLFSDHHALAAIHAIFRYLPRAMKDGNDAEARSRLMYGSVSAGLAFGTAGTAAAHAIQYPVGALTHTAHGLGVATILPYVMAFNAPATMSQLVEIAEVIGIKDYGAEGAATEAIRCTRDLCASVGIPRTLAELGLPLDKLDWVAEQSMLSARLIKNNPRQLSVFDVREIVSDAYYGVH